ncbi:MAG TPA: hypothetical protein VM939_10965 [Gemmatimonadaceae bacterium]|nr:hypothetical protein [Gemmatimonadaceae bacterium]
MKQRIPKLRALRWALSLTAFTALVASSGSAQTTPPPAPVPPDLAVDTGYVIYDKGPFSLPLGIGFRVPSYTRVDGLVLPWGPVLSFADGRVQLDPIVTYRSHLGAFDPSLRGRLQLGARTTLELRAGRGTFTNDGWIRSDLINSAAVIGLGSDARNYFRADRATLDLGREFGAPGSTIEPSFGALFENAWSTGPATLTSNGSDPFSFFGGDDSLKIRRVNPAIARGHIASALGRAAYDYDKLDVKATVDLRLERAFEAPVYIAAENPNGDFTQITIGAKASFPTFGTQRFAFRGHSVVTPGDIAPPQRFAYLGGAGTLATVDLLALGGDNMLYVEGEYYLPLTRPLLPFVGAPVLSARYAAGAAGVGEMPGLIQNIGVGIGLRLIKAEFHIDPSYEKTPFTRRTAFSIGISL